MPSLNRRTVLLALTIALLTLTVSLTGWRTQAGRWLLGGKVTAARINAAPGAAPVFATFTVTNTGDNGGVNPAVGAGTGTLRQALVDANANAGADNIDFALGAGTPTISVLAALPTITDPVNINGNTGGSTRVELNGIGAGALADGLNITAGGSTISSLVINRFSDDGIEMSFKGGNMIVNCYLGTDAAGAADLGNGGNGVFIATASDNVIGGAAAGTRNLISGNNQAGVMLLGGITIRCWAITSARM